MSELYNVGIKVWELDPAGELTSPFDTTPAAVSKGLGTIHLARHRGVHYNSVIPQNQMLPLLPEGQRTGNTDMKDARLEWSKHSPSNGKQGDSLSLLQKPKEYGTRNTNFVGITSKILLYADKTHLVEQYEHKAHRVSEGQNDASQTSASTTVREKSNVDLTKNCSKHMGEWSTITMYLLQLIRK